MRRSISAQSCDSVPPAPELMETKAPEASCGPESMRRNSAWLTPVSSCAFMARTSARVASSSSSLPSSINSLMSPACRSSDSQVVTSFSMAILALRIFWAFSASFQKSGREVTSSSSCIRSLLSSTSKRPPEVVDALHEIFYLGYFLSEHRYGSSCRIAFRR